MGLLETPLNKMGGERRGRGQKLQKLKRGAELGEEGGVEGSAATAGYRRRKGLG
jgi:hypothetical protein